MLLKLDVAELIEDFKNTSNESVFLSENDSDTSIDDSFKFKKRLMQQ